MVMLIHHAGSLGDELVDVIVGQEGTKYTIYKTLLFQGSSFFQAAFAGSFAEAARKSIALEEHNAEAFNIFVYWLYKDHIPFSSDPSITLSTAFEFYFLAEKLLLPRELKIQAWDCIKKTFAKEDGRLTTPEVARVLKITALDCPLRRLVLDLACHHCFYFFTKDKKGKDERSCWLKKCLANCDISEVLEVFDMFEDTLVDSGRLNSLK